MEGEGEEKRRARVTYKSSYVHVKGAQIQEGIWYD